MGMPVSSAYDQDRFNNVANDASDESATLGTTYTSDNTYTGNTVDTTYRFRFTINQTVTDANQSLTITPTLYYSYNSGTWTEVGNPTDTDAPVRVVADANVTDGGSTTLRLGGGYTQVSGYLEDSAPATPSITFSDPATGEATEVEWAIEIYSGYAGLANDDTIALRVYNGATALSGNYDATPTLTVSGISNDVNVDANTATISLTSQDATITHNVNITANTATMSLTAQPATITHNVDISASTATIALTAEQATLTHDVNISASAASMALTGETATIDYGYNIAANTATVSLTGQTATITHDVNITANAATMTLTGQTATITHDVSIAANAASVALTAEQATLTHDVNLAANTASVALTGETATLTHDVSISANTATVALTGETATVTYDVNVAANAATISLTGQTATIDFAAAGVNIDANVATIALVAQPATISFDTGQFPGAAGFHRGRGAYKEATDDEEVERIVEAFLNHVA